VKVRRRFASSRYFLSPAGILKLLVIVSSRLHSYPVYTRSCIRDMSVASFNFCSLCRISITFQVANNRQGVVLWL
jgi:hypothetical protein